MTDIATPTGVMPIDGRGRIPNWQQQGDEESDSVSFTEEVEGEFQQKLINIDEEMGDDDLHGLKFLCADYIPLSKLQSAASPLDIFAHMRKGVLIDTQNVDFLLECLGRIHRFDLIKKLGLDPDSVKANFTNLNKVTDYRRLLMEVAEDMDDKDLEKIRFFLSGKIKKNKLSKARSILDMFIVLEQEQIICPEKPEGVADLMTAIGRPDLVSIVNDFTGTPQERPEPVFIRDPAMPHQPAMPNQLAMPNQPAMPHQPAEYLGQPALPVPAANLPGVCMPQRELMVGSGSSNPGRPSGIDRSPSAGTLTVSESESSSMMDAAASGADLVPAPLLAQIAGEVRHQFNDLGIEFGFTNDELDEYNERYADPQERTKKLIKDWQARKVDKKQIGPGLNFALAKLGQKTAADAVKRWMESRYPGNQGEGQRSSGAQTARAQRVPPGQEFDINYTSSTNEARPANFPVGGNAPEMPVPVGPPINGYEPQEQSENICMSAREAQPHRGPAPIDPQIQDAYLQQIGNQLRHITISSGQLNPQQALNRNTRELSQMINTSNLGQVTAGPPVNPAGGVPAVAPAQAVAPPPASVTDQDAMSFVMPEYKMDKHPRGWCIIINNKMFTVQAGDREAKEMPPRIGTDRDAESLQKVFSDLNFVVHRRDDMSDIAMMKYLVEVSHNVNHKMFDCLVVCILTHGVENHLYGSNGKLVSVKDITSTFQANRCPDLAGKPKLFFLQACQGRNKMQGNELRNPDVIERDAAPVGDLESDNGGKEMIPNEADFLIGYATVPGYVSFRSRNSGSWYIRKLCELLQKYSARHDLLSILVEVNREVSHANAHLDGGIFKQTPAPLVTLRKKLFFK